jgi:hypothetical protein
MTGAASLMMDAGCTASVSGYPVYDAGCIAGIQCRTPDVQQLLAGIHNRASELFSAEYRLGRSTKATNLEYITGASRDGNYNFHGLFGTILSLHTVMLMSRLFSF